MEAVTAGGALGAGVAATAFLLGTRHAFDADHIAAIDNATRRLAARGRRPLGAGLFFSLGHSTVVVAVGIAVIAGVRGLGGAVADQDSSLHGAAAVAGPAVAGLFLLAIGLLNLGILVNLVRALRRTHGGERGPLRLGSVLESRGLLNRVFGRFGRAVRRPWQMYPVGLLFGLGFDTATEVALLVLAAGGAAGGAPLWALACLPLLFAAGMIMFDTLNAAFMGYAYGWSAARPARRAFYDLTMTGLSVAVALAIGAVVLASAADEAFGLGGGAAWLASLDLELVGFAIVALFAATWAAALAGWRLRADRAG